MCLLRKWEVDVLRQRYGFHSVDARNKLHSMERVKDISVTLKQRLQNYRNILKKDFHQKYIHKQTFLGTLYKLILFIEWEF